MVWETCRCSLLSCSLPSAVACTKLARMDLGHNKIKRTGCTYFGKTTRQKLFEDCNGTFITSSSKHFWKEASGLCADSPDWRVLIGFSIQSKGEIFDCHAVVFLVTSKAKILAVRSHQTVWTRTCGLPFSSFLFSHSSFSSVVVRLLALFGRLFLPCCRSSLAFPSRTCFELLNSLSRMIECLYSLSARYRSVAVTITRRLSGS